MKRVNLTLLVAASLALVLPSAAAAAPNKDVCIVSPTGGGSFNTFVLQDVPNLGGGKSFLVHGIFFTGARKAEPVHGTLAVSPDGPILVGMFVHSTAQSLNDFTVSGVLDGNFEGTLNYDNDGDFKPNGTLTMTQVDCGTLDLPWPTTTPTP